MATNFVVEISHKAEKEIKKLPKDIQKRIIRSFVNLSKNPYPSGVKKIQGLENVFRIWEGDYRILYLVKNNTLLILILKIGHRKNVYQNL